MSEIICAVSFLRASNNFRAFKENHKKMLEPLPGVHQLMTQDDTSVFLVLYVELQIEIQYNTI